MKKKLSQRLFVLVNEIFLDELCVYFGNKYTVAETNSHLIAVFFFLLGGSNRVLCGWSQRGIQSL